MQALRLARTAQRGSRLLPPGLSAMRAGAQAGARGERTFASKTEEEGGLAKTPLYDFHLRNGASMVPFASYLMPLSYPPPSSPPPSFPSPSTPPSTNTSIPPSSSKPYPAPATSSSTGNTETQEHGQALPFPPISSSNTTLPENPLSPHDWVRTHAGLFDVSHMVQHLFSGSSATAFLSSLTPSSLSELEEGSSTLSVLLNEEGGIIDDLMLTKLRAAEDGKDKEGGEGWYVVTNAGRRKEDLEWIGKKMDAWNKGVSEGNEVKWERLDGWGLIALQGPKSESILQPLTSCDLRTLHFGTAAYIDINSVRCHVARGGYTGEDGFEISIPPSDAVAITEAIASNDHVALTGLGPRDSLRLEAGMCLYGSDLDESVSPIEAGLSWLIGKDRRASADFPGASRILKELSKEGGGPSRRRVGFVIEGAPARGGAEIYNKDGTEVVGKITSGIPSPTLGTNIAMGYVSSGNHKKGTELAVMVRKKLRPAKVVGMPFVGAKYYRKAALG